MLITRETDYALRILRTLSAGGHFTAGELAEREILPQKFAYKILKKLEKAGFVNIVRGTRGGCSLGCDLRKVTLYELLEAMDMHSRLSACMESGYQCEWMENGEQDCTIHCQLSKVQEVLDSQLRSRSLYWMLYGEDD